MPSQNVQIHQARASKVDVSSGRALRKINQHYHRVVYVSMHPTMEVFFTPSPVGLTTTHSYHVPVGLLAYHGVEFAAQGILLMSGVAGKRKWERMSILSKEVYFGYSSESRVAYCDALYGNPV